MDIILMASYGAKGTDAENGIDITDKAADGTDGEEITEKHKTTYIPATNGAEGKNAGAAQKGSPGNDGLPGGSCGSLILEIKEICGPSQISIVADGGTGGDGSDGGNGGCGQDGGDGGNQLDKYAGEYPQTAGGRGGMGGAGGTGGNGGHGGDGGEIVVKYVNSWLSNPVHVSAKAGNGGRGGAGGNPGQGGAGGRNGVVKGTEITYAFDGLAGPAGSGGAAGEPGEAGSISIRRVEEFPW